MNCRE